MCTGKVILYQNKDREYGAFNRYGRIGIGSGILVSENIFLTAAHVLIKPF
jgi:hypothetical protein